MRLPRQAFTTALHTVARFGAVLGTALSVLAIAGPAAAQETGLTVTVVADDPIRPALLLTNRGASACRVAETGLGTVAVTRAAQGGRTITPTMFEVSTADSLDYRLAERLRVLEPGAELRVPLRVIPFGETGQALETIAWAPGGPALAFLYPLRTGVALTLDVTYALPIAVGNGAPACGLAASRPSSPGRGAEQGESSGRWYRWVVAAGVGVLLAAVLATVVWRRRRHRAVPASAALVLVVAGVLVVDSGRRPAEAEIVVGVEVRTAFEGCAGTLRRDPSGILASLERAGVRVEVIDARGDESHAGALSPTHVLVQWNVGEQHRYFGTGGMAQPCTVLYHELFHAYEDINGGTDRSDCVTSAGPTGIPVMEVNATRAQNRLHAALGLPQRSHYGDKPLPSGDCLPPDKRPKPKPCDQGCGSTDGDPHLITLDRGSYDFQAAGEFVLTRGAGDGGGLEVQVRQEPLPNQRTVSMNTAVAARVGAATVELRLASGAPNVLVDGKPRDEPRIDLPGGGAVVRTGAAGLTARYTITWPDTSELRVRARGHWGIGITMDLAQAWAGRVEGLLGNFDGDRSNDVGPRGGTPLPEITYAALYPAVADSWRLTPEASLFTYAAGQSTATFTDRTMPERELRADNVPNREPAEALCRRMGVIEKYALNACIIDVALTGQPVFATSALETQAYVGSVPATGEQTTLTIDKPGGTARLTFAGKAGQRVFVDVPVATLPDQCGVIRLLAPNGDTVADGCVIGGSGYIDTTVLAVAGEYSVVLAPTRDAAGQARVGIHTMTDSRGSITPNGPELVAPITQPGGQARYTFAGKEGQVVFVDVPTTTLTDQCGSLSIVDGKGSKLNEGCVINGQGYVDRTVLPADGEYTVVIDPNDRKTGTSRVRLVSPTDTADTITLNGPAVTATVPRAGGLARLTFAGAAGQRITVAVTSSDLPNGCGVVHLIGPNGNKIDSGCVIGGAGSFGPVTLPAAGRYTLALDPGPRDTGFATLRLTG